MLSTTAKIGGKDMSFEILEGVDSTYENRDHFPSSSKAFKANLMFSCAEAFVFVYGPDGKFFNPLKRCIHAKLDDEYLQDLEAMIQARRPIAPQTVFFVFLNTAEIEQDRYQAVNEVIDNRFSLAGIVAKGKVLAKNCSVHFLSGGITSSLDAEFKKIVEILIIKEKNYLQN